jgi:MinD-like ATPase involved in chromosome partitioning or flagellar assembly
VPIVFKHPNSLASQAVLKIADEILSRLPARPKVAVKEHPWEEGREHKKRQH